METTTADASTVKRLTAIERETILTALRKKPAVFHEIETGHFGATEWARFEVNTDEVSFNLAGAGRERRQLTDEQRARALQNLHGGDAA